MRPVTEHHDDAEGVGVSFASMMRSPCRSSFVVRPRSESEVVLGVDKYLTSIDVELNLLSTEFFLSHLEGKAFLSSGMFLFFSSHPLKMTFERFQLKVDLKDTTYSNTEILEFRRREGCSAKYLTRDVLKDGADHRARFVGAIIKPILSTPSQSSKIGILRHARVHAMENIFNRASSSIH